MGRSTVSRKSPSPGDPSASATAATGAELARDHDGASDLCDGNARHFRHGLDHDALERALPELTEEQARQEPLLVLGRSPEEICQRIAAGALRPRPGNRSNTRHRLVHLEQLERGRCGRWRRLTKRRPADSDRPLGKESGEIGDRHSDFVGGRLAECLCEPRDLRELRAGGGDVARSLGNLVEEHRRHSTGRRRALTCLSSGAGRTCRQVRAKRRER